MPKNIPLDLARRVNEAVMEVENVCPYCSQPITDIETSVWVGRGDTRIAHENCWRKNNNKIARFIKDRIIFPVKNLPSKIYYRIYWTVKK